ncbi:MAG: urease accessory protein UreD [Candidatus Melainabacteria bacterium]|nr:urease accessory protein UreD [Candidatus Melainabacteria bacterium]
MVNIGIAKLQVECRDGSSVVVDEFSQSPLQLHRPLYLDGASYPTVYLKTPSSGLLGGDDHQVDLSIGYGSRLELRTQAATLVYPGQSSLTININVESGGKLTFLPHALILGASANLSQRVRIDLASDSSLEYSDTWCAGRIAMQELWQFERFHYRLEIFRNRQLLYRENWGLEPTTAGVEHPLVCGDYTHFSTLYTFGSAANRDSIETALPLCEWETNQTWTLEQNSDVITKRCAKVLLV